MSAKNIPRRLASWAVVAFVAAVLYVFITPWYRRGEPSIANWRVIFRFADGDAFDVDYLDYHLGIATEGLPWKYCR
jgi:hypothetical protein